MKTKIKLKRSNLSFSDIKSSSEILDNGEPLIVYDSNSTPDYLIVGNKTTQTEVKNLNKAIKFATSDIASGAVYAKSVSGDAQYPNTHYQLVDSNGNKVTPLVVDMEYIRTADGKSIDDVISDSATSGVIKQKIVDATTPAGDTTSAKIPVVGWNAATQKLVYPSTTTASKQIYMNMSSGVLYGACWNDYAETVETDFTYIPGTCVVPSKYNRYTMSTRDFTPGACIISDTFGFILGGDSDTRQPIGVSGRVLAYVDDEFKVGDVVGSGCTGNLRVMNKLQQILHPASIVGIIDEIPSYETWNDIEVNNRVWVRLK